ncbi:MAG: DUF4286 family protein [Gammaproteobacteria bacterium]|nr:DUF4286 family protein [Gammaproteobacteria bacterium]
MQENFGPVYEVTHHLDPAIIDEFDAWLAQHVEEMLDLPGIVRASTYAADADQQGRPCRVTLYLFESDTDLDNYLAGPAASMRQVALERFEGQFEVTRRILHETEVVDGELKASEECLNCGTTLTGQYCGNCGQRARSRLISIWELMQEAFGDLLELDSRLWRTLIPLTIRPGQLTRDYLEGRRARFMPPFRTYLVLSIFFFLIAFFDPREELGIFFGPEADVAEEPAGDAQSSEEIRDEVLSELVAEGILSQDEAGLERGDDEDGTDEDDEGPEFRITVDGTEASSEDDCADIEIEDMPDWLATRLTPERLTAVCERMIADDGRAFLGKLLDNVPAGLFILLPLMALMLKILYPLSKRYYVEHLLFVIHYHAFIFLILSLQILVSRLTSLASLPDAVVAVTITAVSLYIPIYLYKSMRRVYEQGHLLTLLKFIVLLVSYFMGLSTILLFAALFAAFSI